MRDKPPVGLQHKVGLQGTREHKYFRIFLEGTGKMVVVIISRI